jgi:hypothetical protein
MTFTLKRTISIGAALVLAAVLTLALLLASSVTGGGKGAFLYRGSPTGGQHVSAFLYRGSPTAPQQIFGD